MRSGVSRHRVRSRLRWRMISCPAANEIRCVNPSIATVSPSRTSSATASRIDVTLPGTDPPVSIRSGPSAARVYRALDVDRRHQWQVVRRPRDERDPVRRVARRDLRDQRLRCQEVVEPDRRRRRRKGEPGLVRVETTVRVDPARRLEPPQDVGPDAAIEPQQHPQPERHPCDQRLVARRDRVEVTHEHGPAVGTLAALAQQRVDAGQPRPPAPPPPPRRQVQPDEPEVGSARLDLEEAAPTQRPSPGVALDPAAREAGDRPARTSQDVRHPGDRRDPVDGQGVRRLLKEDDVDVDRANHVADQPEPAPTAEPDVVAGDTDGHRRIQASRTTYGVPWRPLRRSRNQRAIAWTATGRPAISWASERTGSSPGATQRFSSSSGYVLTPGK